MIKTQNLTKVFRNGEVEIRALENINLVIRAGEFVSVMGPSGCGKTTLLNLLGLLETASAGSIIIDGKEMNQLGDKERTAVRKNYMGFVFQNFNLIDELTIWENVELPLLYRNMMQAERKERIGDVLQRFNVYHRKSSYPAELSGGQQQSVAIARAVVGEPKIIFADEPTGNLDSQNGEKILDLLVELNEKGATIVMATHSPGAANKSQRLIQMFDGHIVTENFHFQL